MIILAKIISVILGVLVITKTLTDYRRKQEGLTMVIFWLSAWTAIVILALFPILVEKINLLIGQQGTGINTFLGASFVFLFFVTYRIYTKAERMERKMHDLVMKLGLKDLEKADD